MSDVKIRDLLRRELSDIYAVIAFEMPWAVSLLKALRIVVTNRVPTARVNEREIMINPNFWSALDGRLKKMILLHEAFHLLLRHPLRGKELHDRMGVPYLIMNIAADAVINEMINLKGKGFVTLEIIASMLDMSISELKRMSMEEIAVLLHKQLKDRACCMIAECPIKDDIIPSGMAEREGEVKRGERGSEGDVVVQEGDRELYERTGEEFERELRERLARAYAYAKTAGKVPAGLVREIERLLKPKVDWRARLRAALREGILGRPFRTWLRPNRRAPELAGYKMYSIHDVICLVDTSGSISERELTQFASEIYDILRQHRTSVHVIFWDADAYGPFTFRSPSELISRWRETCKGGGGTVIRPALERALKIMRGGECVVIFSDAEIYDLNKRKTRELLAKIAQRAAKAIFVTTHRDVQIEGFETIKIVV